MNFKVAAISRTLLKFLAANCHIYRVLELSRGIPSFVIMYNTIGGTKIMIFSAVLFLHHFFVVENNKTKQKTDQYCNYRKQEEITPGVLFISRLCHIRLKMVKNAPSQLHVVRP